MNDEQLAIINQLDEIELYGSNNDTIFLKKVENNVINDYILDKYHNLENKTILIYKLFFDNINDLNIKLENYVENESDILVNFIAEENNNISLLSNENIDDSITELSSININNIINIHIGKFVLFSDLVVLYRIILYKENYYMLFINK